jgi:hypothetical protein
MSGGCTLRFAGYGLSYRGKMYALPLHPVDGQLDSISTDGEIENLVLLTYGPTSAAKADDNPEYTGAYYGGGFTFGYSTREADDTLAPRRWLVLDSVVEITLTPDGPLLDGSKGRVLVIRKKITPRGYFPSTTSDWPLQDQGDAGFRRRATTQAHRDRAREGREAMTPNSTTGRSHYPVSLRGFRRFHNRRDERRHDAPFTQRGKSRVTTTARQCTKSVNRREQPTASRPFQGSKHEL